MNFEELHEKNKICSWCNISPICRKIGNVVTGQGPQNAKLMLVGEAAGEREFELGEPFKGVCGRLLDNVLNKVGLPREEIFISNCVRCRPYLQNGKFLSNRPPTDEEIQNCKGWLWQEIKLIRPKIILCLGKVSTRLLNGIKKKVFKLQDYFEPQPAPWKIDEYCPLLISFYHPSFVLRNGKKYTEEMEEQFMKVKDLC